MNTASLQAWLEQDVLFSQVVTLLQSQAAEVWIVGGTVRDALLGRPSDDLDLAVSGGALALGRSLAAALGGTFFPLDSSRQVGRVIVGKTGRHIDLAGLRASDIRADLRARDFTINAMAVSIRCLDELLDPTNGTRDLQQGVLRTTNCSAFEDDPLRILRAVRLRSALGFTLDADTVGLLQQAMPKLAQVAMERLRDELLLILGMDNAAGSLCYLHDLGCLPHFLPRLGVPSEAVGSLEPFILLEPWLSKDADWGSLAPWRDGFEAQWSAALASGRTRRVILKLAGLLANVPQPADAAQVGHNLYLSTRECQHLQNTIAASRQFGLEQELDTPLGIYDYYHRYAEAGLDGALLVFAALDLPVDRKAVVRSLLVAWFTRYHELVDPTVLLTGDALQSELRLAEGPRIGRALELLRRAQVQGLVHNRAEACAYLTSHLSTLE